MFSANKVSFSITFICPNRTITQNETYVGQVGMFNFSLKQNFEQKFQPILVKRCSNPITNFINNHINIVIIVHKF
ncbi:MAG: hypothetical protein BGO78_00320 [Chloroflexi bacterium 44-23]|nr:MAG: hypothetical protein BGO78_00320 [Chloroflexi bacterium 44-23]